MNYVYVYLDPRKPGNYQYGEYEFAYEPFYVGEGCGNRNRTHLYRSTKDTKYLKNKIKKIQRTMNVVPFIIKQAENLSNGTACALEIDMIATIGRWDLRKGPLLNMTNGGDKGPVGRIPWNKGRKGVQISWNKGKTGIYSDETLERMRGSQKGKIHTKETREKIGVANKGKHSQPRTEEWRNKISDTLKGRKFIGRHRKAISKGVKEWWKNRKLE